jgi:signal transduction histidine kinase
MAAVALVGVGASVAGAQLTLVAQRGRVERRAALVAASSAARMASLDPAQRQRLAAELSDALGLAVSVADGGGGPLAGAGAGPVAAGDIAVAEAPIAGEIGRPARVRVAAPLPSSAAARGAVALLGVKLLVALLVMGSVAVVVTLIVAQDITADLQTILRRALRMGAGAAAMRPLPVRARDDVGALVAAFNRLQRRFVDELALHRNALARLEEHERRRETLIATLRHELRTPLNAVLGFAEILLQEVDGPLTDAQRDDVTVIARSGASLLRLVDDVLDLSAMASGRYEIRREPVDLAELARAVVAEAQGIARTRDVALALEAPPRAELYADPVALRRALVNLVVNAVEHAGGEVVVTVSSPPRGLAVAVRDNGPGIAPAELKRLFKPFERGPTAEARGAGLGLAITLGLVELHGGTLSAQSVVGEGSTFTVNLPAGMAPLPGTSP